MLYVPKVCEVLRWQMQILSLVSQENGSPDSKFVRFKYLVCDISCRKEHKKNNQTMIVLSSMSVFLISVRNCLKPWNTKLNVPFRVAIIMIILSDTFICIQLLTYLLNHLQFVISMILNSRVFHTLTHFKNH